MHSTTTPLCRIANLDRPDDASLLVDLLDAYASDPMGGGRPLPEAVRANLASALAARPGVTVFFAEVGGQAAGLAICMEGFSTFACKPLINVHDLAVLPSFRRQGVARALLQHIETLALQKGCCKITLEVLSNNDAAQQAYRKAGFEGYQLDPTAGQALFWQKKLA